MSLQFLKFAISCLYFFFPAYFANMTPPILMRLGFFNFLAKPIDFNKKFLGKPILGSHKTWRGAIFAFLVGFSCVLFQKLLYRFQFFKEISLLDYQNLNIFLFATLFSLGAVFGDLFFAFIKRRIGLLPGAPFLPFDQTNYLIGVAIFLTPFKIKIQVWIFLFPTTFFLHILVNRIGYHLKISRAKW